MYKLRDFIAEFVIYVQDLWCYFRICYLRTRYRMLLQDLLFTYKHCGVISGFDIYIQGPAC